MSWIASHTSTLAFVFSALALVLIGFLFTLFINPRIKDVDELKVFAGKLVAWKIPENIEKLNALEIRMSEDAGRNLPQRADNLEGATGDLSQRLSKLEGAEAERNRRLEEVLKKFDPLIDEISKQISEGDESNVLSLLKVKEIAFESAVKLAKLGDKDAEDKYRAELDSTRAEIRRRQEST